MRLNRSLRAVAAPGADEGVTTLELFFDLVFVFTITQVTSVVRGSDGIQGYLRALAILVVTWWMYDGYCWLSNNIGPTTLETRLPMLVAMAGFLVMAVATPDAFRAGAWPFAVSYVVVVVVHGVQFGRSSLGGSGQAIWRVMRLNLGIGVGLVLAAALAPHGLAWVGWGLSLAVIALEIAQVQGSGFTLRADHFAERHQLLIIIALGETVVATGAGAQGRLREVAVLLAVLLSLALLAALWWVYFGGDDARGAEALANAAPETMTREAFWAYSMLHFFHIVGLILVAAGLHQVVASPRGHLLVRSSVTLAAGTAVFLLAEAAFRRLLSLGSVRPLLVAAVVCALPGFLGPSVDGLVELGALGAVVVGALVLGQSPDEAAEP
jgi:low temperature requirement protein LtrA